MEARHLITASIALLLVACVVSCQLRRQYVNIFDYCTRYCSYASLVLQRSAAAAIWRSTCTALQTPAAGNPVAPHATGTKEDAITSSSSA